LKRQDTGRLEVIAGCMFSGKTERLIARLRAAQQHGKSVRAFKHYIDDRYDPDHLVTHTQDQFDAQRIRDAAELLQRGKHAEVIGIDEGHFFGEALVNVVIVAGIDYDAWGRPFPPFPQLIDRADEVMHTYAACRVCGGQARYSQRMVPVDSQVMVGGAEAYEPRCARCFQPLASPPPEEA
jgi:thymidine kinase